MSAADPTPLSQGRGELFRVMALAGSVLVLAVPEVLFPGVPQAAAVLLLLAVAVGDGLLVRALDLVGAVFLLLAVLGVVWSVDTGQSVVTVMGWMAWGALWLLPRARDGWLGPTVAVALVLFAVQAARQLLGGLADAGGAAQELALAAEMRGFAELWAQRGRALGPFASPDMLASCVLAWAAIPLAFATARAPGTGRVVLLLGGALGVALLLSSQSVGALVSLSAAVLLVGGVAARHHARMRRGFVVAALLLVGATGGVVAWRAQQGGAQQTVAQPAQGAARDRLEDWGNALAMVRHVPMWGVGPGAFESAFNAHSPPGRRYAAYVHNTTLQVVVEMGVLGGLLVLAVYLLLLRDAWLAARQGGAANLILAVGVVAGVLHHQLDYAGHTLAGAGLFLAAGVLRSRLRETVTPTVLPVRLAAGMLALGAAWVCAGISLCERNVPRLPGEGVDISVSRRGAALLSFDAHAWLAVAQDAQALAHLQAERGEDATAAWALHDQCATRAAALAPQLPMGPMMLARGHLERGQLEQALPAFHAAVARSCCSRRLHLERRITAAALGDQATVAQDEAWLREVGAPVPPLPVR